MLYKLRFFLLFNFIIYRNLLFTIEQIDASAFYNAFSKLEYDFLSWLPNRKYLCLLLMCAFTVIPI